MVTTDFSSLSLVIWIRGLGLRGRWLRQGDGAQPARGSSCCSDLSSPSSHRERYRCAPRAWRCVAATSRHRYEHAERAPEHRQANDRHSPPTPSPARSPTRCRSALRTCDFPNYVLRAERMTTDTRWRGENYRSSSRESYSQQHAHVKSQFAANRRRRRVSTFRLTTRRIRV